MVSGGTGSEMPDDDGADELAAVAVGVPVAPAMPVAAVVGPAVVVDAPAPPAAVVLVAAAEDDEPDPLAPTPALPPGGTVPTGEPGTDVSPDDEEDDEEDDEDSGEAPVPAWRTPVKSFPVTPTSVSAWEPPLTIAADSSASPP